MRKQDVVRGGDRRRVRRRRRAGRPAYDAVVERFHGIAQNPTVVQRAARRRRRRSRRRRRRWPSVVEKAASTVAGRRRRRATPGRSLRGSRADRRREHLDRTRRPDDGGADVSRPAPRRAPPREMATAAGLSVVVASARRRGRRGGSRRPPRPGQPVAAARSTGGPRRDAEASAETGPGGADDVAPGRTPAPDAASKPEGPEDLHKRTWTYALRKTAKEFGSDQCTDLAAALVYYSVLALGPGDRRDRVDPRTAEPRRGEPADGPVLGAGARRAHPASTRIVTQLITNATKTHGGGHRPGRRHPRRAVVRLRLRRCVRARDEPDLQHPRGPPGLEAAAHAAAGHGDRGRARRARGADPRVDRARSCSQIAGAIGIGDAAFTVFRS